jgi:hypothetical protein
MQAAVDLSQFKPISSHDKNAWREIIAEWEKGNESQTKFCKDRGLNKNTLCYWRGKFRRKSDKSIKPVKSPQTPAKLVPVKLFPSASSKPGMPLSTHAIKLQTPQGYLLSMPNDVGVEFIVRLLQRLGGSRDA